MTQAPSLKTTPSQAPSLKSTPFQAPSLKTTPFSSFGTHSFGTLFTSDYVHKKFGNFNVKAPTLKNGNFGLKLGVNVNESASTPRQVSLSDEVKLGFPIAVRSNSLYLETRLRRNGEVKVHLDGGSLKVIEDVNLFANLKTNMSLDNFTYRLGANYFGKNCDSGTRLEITNAKDFFLTQRNILKKDSFLFAFILAANVNDLRLTKYDALFKYNHNLFDIFVQHFTPAKSLVVQAGKVGVNVVYNLDSKTNFGAHYKYDFARKKSRVVIGALHKLNEDLTLKGKVDQKLKVTASSKYKINDKLTLTVSGQLNLQNGSKAFDFNKLVPIPFGFNLDVNV